MPNSIYESRRKRFCNELEKRGVEKAIVGRPTSMFYLTGRMFTPYERFFGLFLDAKTGTAGMILPSLEQGTMKEYGVEEVLYLDSEDPSEAIARVVGDCGLLGMETNYYAISIGSRLFDRGVRLADVGGIVAGMRMRKDASEIEAIRNAALCADGALRQALPMLRPGVMEKEFSVELYRHMVKTPAVIPDTFVIQILGGANSANPHGVSGDYAFQKGDMITVDFGAYYGWYWSDFCRTFFIGEPTDRQRRIYDIVLRAHMAAKAVVKPGVSAKAVDAAAREVITKEGYGPQFIHRTGHGVGLDIHEEPYIHASNEFVLEEGIVFTVEPGIYIPGLGGVRIEDDVAVTKDGHISLNSYPKDIESMILVN